MTTSKLILVLLAASAIAFGSLAAEDQTLLVEVLSGTQQCKIKNDWFLCSEAGTYLRDRIQIHKQSKVAVFIRGDRPANGDESLARELQKRTIAAIRAVGYTQVVEIGFMTDPSPN